jgi:uncharacterized protein (TIGR02996 family)
VPRYEFSEGSSNKFWDITLAGKSFTTTYGKIGANGQTTIKTFKSDAQAKSEYEKLIAEKVKKGYAPADGGNGAAASPKNGKCYFEQGDKFWEVFVDGNSVKTRFGKVGSQGQMRLKDFKSKSEAETDLEGQVAKKVKEGFAEAAGGGGGATKAVASAKSNPALEKAILANPLDDTAYMVYADWLQDQGDPRGELIALQAGGKDKEAKKLLDKHIDYFLGPLKAHQKTHDDDLGNNARVNSKAWIKENQQAFKWKNGFIYRLRLAYNAYVDDTFKDKTLAKDVLAPLLAHPSGKYIVEIALNENGEVADDDLQDIIDVLAKHAPLTLRKLHIGDNVDQISWYRVGNLGKLWKAVPNLTHFEIEAGEFTLGNIELPNLEWAKFKTGGLAKADAKSIAKAKWPKLAHLEVFYGDEEYGGDATAKDVLPLLDRTDLPKLKYLAVKNAMFQNELVPYLARSRLVKQLTTLDLSEGVLTDDSVDSFLSHADAFKHLVLDVSETYLSKDALKKLKGVAKQIIAKDMRDDDDPEYRYVGTGE